MESIIKEEECTKAAMGKMNTLDSFLKEAQRVHGTVGVCKLVLGTLYCFALKTAQSECVV